MSRTIRRTGKNVDPDNIKSYTHTDKCDFKWIEKHRGTCQISRLPLKIYPLPEKEYWKGYWTFHRDNPDFSGHNKRHHKSNGAVRTTNRNDLARWLSNEEHICIFWEDFNRRDYN